MTDDTTPKQPLYPPSEWVRKWGHIRVNRENFNRYKAAAALFDCTQDQFMSLVLDTFAPLIDEYQEGANEKAAEERAEYEERMKRVRKERIARLKEANLKRAAEARKRRLQSK